MARVTPVIKMPLRGGGGARGGARGPCILWGSFTIGAAGAISAVSGFLPLTVTAGTFGIIKTAGKTGRYSLFFDRKYRDLTVIGMPTLQGPADAAIGNTNANDTFVRNVTTQSFDIQLILGSTGADTDAASGTVISFCVGVSEYGGKS
jgi:hypothetical protein